MKCKNSCVTQSNLDPVVIVIILEYILPTECGNDFALMYKLTPIVDKFWLEKRL